MESKRMLMNQRPGDMGITNEWLDHRSPELLSRFRWTSARKMTYSAVTKNSRGLSNGRLIVLQRTHCSYGQFMLLFLFSCTRRRTNKIIVRWQHTICMLDAPGRTDISYGSGNQKGCMAWTCWIFLKDATATRK